MTREQAETWAEILNGEAFPVPYEDWEVRVKYGCGTATETKTFRTVRDAFREAVEEVLSETRFGVL